jgi:hypothetical protein
LLTGHFVPNHLFNEVFALSGQFYKPQEIFKAAARQGSGLYRHGGLNHQDRPIEI